MGVIYKNGVYYSGPPGRGIRSIVHNNDATITITLTDGSEWTSESLQGPRGNGISSVTVNEQGAFVFVFEDGTSYTSDPVNALPDVTINDSGKILQVDDNGEWEVTDYNPLPEVDASDEGKGLYVDENGDTVFAYSENDVWMKYTDGDDSAVPEAVKVIHTTLPDVDESDAGKVLMVSSDGNWTIGELIVGDEVEF